jgi:cytochrome P450
MSTTEQRAPVSSRTPGRAHSALPVVSLADSLKVLLVGVLPALVRGLFSPRKSAMKLLGALDSDRRAVATLAALRRKHDGEGIRLLGGRLVVLWGTEAIREVLDRSADLYASDAGAKAKGMSHFQPDALTLSRDEEWRDRRAFTEAVLATSQRVHPSATQFLAVINDEVEQMRLGSKLEWIHWERLFDHLTLRIIFGDEARSDQRVTELLEKLMQRSNRLVGLKHGDDYYEFYGALERRLRDPGPHSLLARVQDAPQDERTRVVQQIPHWMFAMRDTLAANAYRALAVIMSEPQVERRVRQELDSADLADPHSIDAMRYLEGCLQEAMRLWPTSPLLARETTRPTRLSDEHLDAGTQVMLLNVFNHRDPDHVDGADQLMPERRQGEPRNYCFNHLSNGSQDCPGGPLVLLLGKAVIAKIMSEYRLALEHPTLAPEEPLPHMLDFFAVRFAVERGSAR